MDIEMESSMELKSVLLHPLLFLFAGLSALSVQAEPLVFSTAPTQSAEKTRQMYQPIVDHLAKATGREIVLKPARNFLEYTNNLQHDRYDIVFDGPHFIGWRMQKLGHRVVAKLPGKITFVIVIRDGLKVQKYPDLAGRKVCAFNSPNLLTLGFLDLYPSPASQPILIPVNSFKGALECVHQGNGVAAVMRDKFWEKQPDKNKQGLKLLYTTTQPFPHRAFSVSKRVDETTRKKITRALVGELGMASGAEVLQTFRSKQFLLPSDKEYRGLGALLQPIWGYRE
jgi:ABC-type phosphate/phosphonate transport system substrate-binding protein